MDMRTGLKLFLGILIIILTTLVLASPFLIGAYSDVGGYTARPGSGSPEAAYEAGITQEALPVSFWQLPLWVQVAGTVDGILLLIGTLYFLPFVFGKVQNLLANRNRLDIFNYVLSNPGCTQSEISERYNMNNGTVKYHVLMLEAQGKINLKKMGKYIRLYNSARANSDMEKAVLAHVKNETSKNLLCAIMEEPGVTNHGLSEKFSIDKSSVHWHIERFINDKLIRFDQEGRSKKYYLEPGVVDLLIKKDPSPVAAPEANCV
jgi:predicted transcriptional regulator